VLHGIEDAMDHSKDHSFAVSVFIGMALYAVIGVLGFVILGGPELSSLGPADGYGVASIASPAVK
jgi:hypothetical protein